MANKIAEIASLSVGIIADLEDSQVEWRQGTSGGWTAFTADSVVFHNRSKVPEYSETEQAETLSRIAIVTIQLAEPKLQEGYQIRVDADDAQIWAVIEGPNGENVAIYNCRLRPQTKYKPDRGRIE